MTITTTTTATMMMIHCLVLQATLVGMTSYLKIRFGSWFLLLLILLMFSVACVTAMTSNISYTDGPLTVGHGAKKAKPGR